MAIKLNIHTPSEFISLQSHNDILRHIYKEALEDTVELEVKINVYSLWSLCFIYKEIKAIVTT